MSTPSNAMSESIQAQSVAPAAFPATRALYWSVRRELWENRSIYLAPLAVAAVALFAFSISAIAGIWEKALKLDPAQASKAVTQPYDIAAGLMMLTCIIVSVFYCLDALHSERRDRSILFWKSLPVSDLTTVLAKVSIPLVVLPLLTFDRRRHAGDHVAVEQLTTSGERSECGGAVDEVVVLPDVAADALPHFDGPCALAFANLLLAASGIRMGATRDISMGCIAAGRHCRRRTDRVPHRAFRCLSGVSIDRSRASF